MQSNLADLRMLMLAKRISGTLAILLWFSSSWLWVYQANHAPQARDLASGREFALTNHGTTVFLTFAEIALIYALMLAAGVLFASTAIIHLVQRKR